MAGLSERERRARLEYFFRDYVATTSRILEIGSADGWLGDYLRNTGFHGYRRIDPAGRAGAAGWWSPDDFRGDIRDWRQLGIGPASFDFVVAFDVLDEIDCLGECFEILAPGGYLFVVTLAPGRGWLARLLARLGLRRAPAGPTARRGTLDDLHGFRRIASRRRGLVELWALLRKPLEPPA